VHVGPDVEHDKVQLLALFVFVCCLVLMDEGPQQQRKERSARSTLGERRIAICTGNDSHQADSAPPASTFPTLLIVANDYSRRGAAYIFKGGGEENF
jgi:hypothetical protein